MRVYQGRVVLEAYLECGLSKGFHLEGALPRIEKGTHKSCPTGEGLATIARLRTPVTGMKLQSRNADGTGSKRTGCTAALHTLCAWAS